jgi:hypothetical protein
MAQYKGAAREGQRAAHLMKKREKQKEELELLKKKIADVCCRLIVVVLFACLCTKLYVILLCKLVKIAHIGLFHVYFTYKSIFYWLISYNFTPGIEIWHDWLWK